MQHQRCVRQTVQKKLNLQFKYKKNLIKHTATGVGSKRSLGNKKEKEN